MSLKVFVAGSFLARSSVLVVHEQLRERGMTPVSSWANAKAPDGASGDWFFSLPLAMQQAINERNDADLASAHVVLLIGDARGKESYAEMARALLSKTPVIWEGYRTTSCLREGVVYVGDGHGQALMLLETLNRAASQCAGASDEWTRALCWKMATSVSDVVTIDPEAA